MTVAKFKSITEITESCLRVTHDAKDNLADILVTLKHDRPDEADRYVAALAQCGMLLIEASAILNCEMGRLPLETP